MRIHRLSKSRFIAGLKCERRLWMLVNRPSGARDPTLAEERRMQFGTDFGRDVTKLFPGGVEITADYRHPQEALDDTASQLKGEAPALFEAAFLNHDVLVRADILKRSQTNPDAWDLIEVKSSSNSSSSRDKHIKEYLSDMAIQLYVLEASGLRVESISLALANSKYERIGELDWEQLVAIEDYTDDVRARATQIGSELDAFLPMIDRPEIPEAVFGKTKCGECPFEQVCWGEEPEDSLIHLPRITPKKLDDLRALGVKRIPDIPLDYDLSKTQAPMREAYNYPNGKLVERDRLTQWVEQLKYPLYYFDFETWNPCIPPFDKTRPYLQIPFQYSVHIQEEPGAEPTHREFLAGTDGDPRPELIDGMIEDLGETGSIAVHHAGFESDRIRDLAVFSPTHKEVLLAMLDRIVDTEIPFKNNWYLHPGLMGRSSIKVVLPTLVPEKSYEGMEIADGQSASVSFDDMYEGRVVDKAAENVRRDLIDYCRLDTLAMVEILRRLRELIGG